MAPAVSVAAWPSSLPERSGAEVSALSLAALTGAVASMSATWAAPVLSPTV
jgi:hypothetical protein